MNRVVLNSGLTRQPQYPAGIDWSNPITKGLVVAINGAMPLVNLVNGRFAASQSGYSPLSYNTSGAMFSGGSCDLGFGLNAANGLTLFSIWGARPAQYRVTDLTSLLSTRTSGNAGWTWGTSGAVAGTATTGNLTHQSLTFQGVAQYIESNYTIPSLIDTPVACRYNPTTGKISWFSNGSTSSPDTTASSPSNGANVIFGIQGPTGSGLIPWIDRASIALAWNRPLSDSEIVSISLNPWQIFRPPSKVLDPALLSTNPDASANWTDGADVLSGSVGVQVSVNSGTVDGADVLAANVGPQISLSSAITDGADVLAAAIGPLVTITSTTTDGADVLAASVSISNGIGVSASWTDGADVLASGVDALIAVQSATTDGADVLAGTIGSTVGISSATTDGADILSALVSPLNAIDFSANWTDGRDTLVANIITGDAVSGLAKSDGDEHTKRKVKDRQKRRQTIQEQLEAIFEPAKKQSEEIRSVIAKQIQVTENLAYVDSEAEDVEILLLMA